MRPAIENIFKTHYMAEIKNNGLIPDELVMTKILVIRGKKVMIDRDLAELYGVTTKSLNQQVKRNLKRFPADFMFQLTEEEKKEVVTNCDHLISLKFSPQLPYVFTEHGAVMLASVLNSERAIEVNVQIVRIFIRMRELLMSNQEILLKLEQLEKKVNSHDGDITMIFKYLKQLINQPDKPRPRVGFRRNGERD
jgi:ribosomal protein L23